MDWKQVLRDPKSRLVRYVVIGFVAALLGSRLGHPSAVHTPAEKLAELDRIGFPPRMLIAIALWMIPAVYWEIAARNQTKVKEPARTRAVHLLLTSLAQFLVILPVPGLRARFLPLTPLLWGPGLAIEVFAVVLTVWARRILGKNWSGAIATNVDHELIRRGPYRTIRHPIYTGIICQYLGTAIVSGEMHALIGLALCLIAYARKIQMEEAHLHEAFGPAYADYAQHSKRLIPGIY